MYSINVGPQGGSRTCDFREHDNHVYVHADLKGPFTPSVRVNTATTLQ